ncbi:MAG: T9SS type A sorting domain-containing protein [Bacteroidetes bacterium]|nr:T9SS type A sorting domain-containing protein [Bacteroidota bacterium]
MKRIFTLILVALVIGKIASYGQVLITQIYEGNVGNNKHIEITNIGTSTVDLASPQYTIKLFSNKAEIGTNSPTKTYNLVGTVTAGQSLLVRHTSATIPAYALTYTPFDSTNTVTSFNGAGTGTPIANTDIIALYQGTTLVDVFAWGTFQYNDKSYYRSPAITAPNATFTQGEWIETTLTAVESAATNTIERLGYHPQPVTTPYLAIASPLTNATLYSTTVPVSFSVLNFTIGTDGHIHYIVDGGSVNEHTSTTPIQVTGLTAGSHTVALSLVDNSHNPLSPAVTASITFNVNLTFTDKTDIAALRACDTSSTVIYRLTGTSTITFQQTYRHQRFIQDTTAAILIDDYPGNFTTAYNQGDAIANIVGKLNIYGNMLQFTPLGDPGTPVSTGNTVTPTVITLTQFNNDFELYEAQLVKIQSVNFKDANGSITFTIGKGYALQTSVDSFRTTFYDANYMNLVVPTNSVNIIGILNARTSGNYITARNLADIEGMNDVPEVNVSNETGIYPNPANDMVTLQNLKGVTKIEIANILGQTVNVYNNIKDGNMNLSLSHLKNGIYFVTLYNNNERIKTMKFTKN